MSVDYQEFIASKRLTNEVHGFNVELQDTNENAFKWQKRVIQWALRRGRAALFLDTGLGKTLCQLAWADHVVRRTGGRVMLHCPVGVRQQTYNESVKFGIQSDVLIADKGDALPERCIVIANYEKIHKFDTSKFTGVVLDESSILKSFTGTIKRSLCDNWSHARYRLACTATPSPNDHMELGNHSQFLGVMNSNEMLSRWFYNDTMQAGGYKILPHGEEDFWEWVSSWAACVSMPSDIGGDDSGYILPTLHRIDHVVVPKDETPDAGCLFFVERELTATTVHKEKRRSTPERAAKVAEVVMAEPDEPWLVWCDTNYEADQLIELLPDAVDLRGSESEVKKEAKLSGFSDGSIRVLITKPTVAGFGMNWQHCSRMAFIGLSYSYEQYYQAVRRCWRFGQNREVYAHVVMAEGEQAITRANQRKHLQHLQMQQGMRDAINKTHDLSIAEDKELRQFDGQRKAVIPSWL